MEIFEQHIVVTCSDIDALGHVNNVVYLQWLEHIALAHSSALGLGLADYQRLNHAMVVSEHHLKYCKACFEGDELLIRTWLGELTAYRSVRHYAIYRARDKAIVMHGSTLWVCIELSSGRLKRLSPTFSHAYQPLAPDIDPMQF